MTASWEEAYKGIEPSNKSKEIASEKIYGWQPFTPEQVEAQRHKIGIGLKGFAGGLLGSLGDLSEFAQSIAGIEKPFKILPSSQDVGAFFEKASGEKFTPETTGEQFLFQGTTGLGSILGLGGPIKGATKLGTLARTALGAFVPAGVATITEKEKLPPWMQAASTIGSSFLLHRLTGKGLKDMERALYKKVNSLVPEGTTVPAPKLESKIGHLESDLKKGLEATSESAVLKTLDKLRNKIIDGEIGVDELAASRRSLVEMRLENEIRKSPRARNLLNSLFDGIDETIENYGQKNPEYLKLYRQANSLHKGLQESKSIEHFIKKNPYLAIAGATFLQYISPFTTGATVVLGKGAALGSALARNPGLRKAYWEVLKNASKEEGKATLSSLKKFNKEAEKSGLEKEGKEDQWEQAFETLNQ